MKKSITKGKFFDLNDKKISKNQLSSYIGWSKVEIKKLIVQKIPSNKIFKLAAIEKYKINKKKKEFLLILIQGQITVEDSIVLNPMDFLNFSLNEFRNKIVVNKKSLFFLISCPNLKKIKLKKYNFLRDSKKLDLWGGKCISRVCETDKMTIVFFSLKKGFRFEDNGHHNEQITFLTNGSMLFYNGKIKKKLTTKNGVDVGKNMRHGGYCTKKALGFDVFYPKRTEKRYLN